jgi:UDP-N-acetylmuramate dehydrogenase
MSICNDLPKVRGTLEADVVLAPFTWFRVGGPAQALFQPVDEDDLADFLRACPAHIPIMVFGVGSNLIVRDGGFQGVIIRLPPRGFGHVSISGLSVTAGAACLDAVVARKAADAGIAGLEFYRGVPGTIGGALRMNAGCYEQETKDVLTQCVAYNRAGERIILSNSDMGFSYRYSAVAEDLIFVSATFEGTRDEPANIVARMDAITARREASQPIREKTGGSTFKNPDPVQSKGRSSWQVIDDAGLRGHIIGGAQMSEKHCNFMINRGQATAADLEALGEHVRAEVKKTQDVDLDWEIKRVGVPLGSVPSFLNQKSGINRN